jgi:hypothetical protein
MKNTWKTHRIVIEVAVCGAPSTRDVIAALRVSFTQTYLDKYYSCGRAKLKSFDRVVAALGGKVINANN